MSNDIEEYEFYDDDVLDVTVSGSILDIRLEHGASLMELTKEDVIALAKHFKLSMKEGELIN